MHFKERPSPIMNFLNVFSGDGTLIHPLKILKSVPVVADKTIVDYHVSLVRKWYLFISYGKNKLLVTQLKTKVVLNNYIFIIGKVLDKPLFGNLINDIKSRFQALLEFHFKMHSVLQINLARQHLFVRRQQWNIGITCEIC